MGMYDMITGICPYCKEEVTVQTKLTPQEMNNYTAGDRIPFCGEIPEDFNLEMKDKCKCGQKLVAEIENGVFRGFITEKAHIKELPFGDWEEVWG